MLPAEEQRLQCLIERLRALEQRRVPPHEQAILDIARASVRDAIQEMAHRLHDGDYCRRASCGDHRRSADSLDGASAN